MFWRHSWQFGILHVWGIHAVWFCEGCRPHWHCMHTVVPFILAHPIQFWLCSAPGQPTDEELIGLQLELFA